MPKKTYQFVVKALETYFNCKNINQTWKKIIAQLAGAVEYTVCTSAER